MQRGSIGFAVAVFTTAASLTYADAAVDPCLGTPAISENGYPAVPALTDVSRIPIEVPYDAPQGSCTGTVVTVQRPDGSAVTTVPLVEEGGRFNNPAWRGWFSPALATGTGDWVITKVAHAGAEVTTNVSFRVVRGTSLTLEQPARTSGTVKTTFTGLVRNYTSTGALVPAPGRTVRLLRSGDQSVVATLNPAANGRYAVQLALTQALRVQATTAATSSHAAAYAGPVTAHKLLAMSYLTASATATVNNWWKVSGTAFPGKLWTTLHVWNGSAWQDTLSYGYTAANGSYARYWKPDRPGTFRLRVSVSGPGLDNSPWSREATVTVRQLPQAPTYFVGTVVAPTAGLPIHRDSMLSSFGTLKYRRANGTLGPVGNQVVQIFARRVGEASWTRVNSVRTAVSGYFYTRWGHFYDVGQSFQVMLTYPTQLPQAASSATGVFGPFTVQG
ncbi:hypothetical protein ACQPXM_01815 [Kribbella sp. CA-253562]|uniref:hypothetical protein n=1 Tax=Kribbella sp. CA-253562 TaxID=3239942 RepID=UPI003D92DA55